MPLFLATYTHPDPDGWRRHLRPHLEWIAEHVAAGTLRASGPTTGCDLRTAALLFDCPDRRTVETLIATDPYAVHGQVGELVLAKWDPIFGDLNADSSAAGKSVETAMADILASFEAGD